MKKPRFGANGDDLTIQEELIVGYSMISSSNEQQELYFELLIGLDSGVCLHPPLFDVCL